MWYRWCISHRTMRISTVVILVIITGTLLRLQFGTVSNVVLYVRGSHFRASPLVVDVGTGSPGEIRKATVKVRSLAFSAIRLVGANTTCNCLIVDDLPVTIEPRAMADVTFSIYLPIGGGRSEQSATLMFDVDGHLEQERIVIVGNAEVNSTLVDR